jgi:hypothetical protein
MNLTIAVDDKVLERARSVARRRGISLQELLRQMLESLAGSRTAADDADELIGLLRSTPGRSQEPIRREDAYDGRL